MPSLCSLPPELIREILSYLPLQIVEQVALTFTHPITEISIPMIQGRLKARRTLKRLSARFGGLNYEPKVDGDFLGSQKGRRLLNLSPRDIIKTRPPAQLPDLSYLNLCGDLNWLKPLGERLDAEAEEPPSIVFVGPEFEDMVKSAQQAEVELPPSFLVFIQDAELRRRVLSSNAAYFRLGEGGLHKVPESLDGGAGGYMIRILSDQQGCYFIHLYLEPGKDGAHCLLLTYDDYYSRYDTDDEDEKNVADDDMEVSLVGVDFEEWLANMYYEEMLWYVLHDLGDSCEELEAYVKNVFL
ncbi:hypothetical protein JX265_000432 [Neoarthrinium moseri]|uniref:F-box domain-containing protein n=1 Tax=Neoarthrinium moseri TaxID=1658444 RepID=A0A9P9WYI5_9PEZI|nr:hypothetical protein JX265_000432 [Neoarthrinium moseri]